MKQTLTDIILIILCIIVALLAAIYMLVLSTFRRIGEFFKGLVSIKYCVDCGQQLIVVTDYDEYERCLLCGARQDKKPNKYAAAKRKEVINKVIKKNGKVLRKLARE